MYPYYNIWGALWLRLFRFTVVPIHWGFFQMWRLVIPHQPTSTEELCMPNREHSNGSPCNRGVGIGISLLKIPGRLKPMSSLA